MTAALPRAVQSAVEQEILTTVSLLMDPGSVAELRIPKAGRHGTISGYFNDPAALTRAAVQFDAAQLPGVYITLNPCNPALLARAVNRVRYRADLTTADADILRRRWLLIDCDPRRPAGISSTDKEHGRAIATACGIWDDLHSIGWPDPVVCDSGNGAHLLYRVDLANTPAATQSIKATLAGIAQHSAPDDVAVDVNVYNASRITKLYGTTTRKGDHTQERPHRRSRILEIPDELKVVDL